MRIGPPFGAAALACLSLAFLVAAAIKRAPADFSALPVVAVLRDGDQHPAWAIRLAPAAHQIAADRLRPQPAPAGRAFELWLSVPDGAPPHPLGLLPTAGRRVIAVIPELCQKLRAGELMVTLEPAGGFTAATPTGPELFRGSIEGSDRSDRRIDPSGNPGALRGDQETDK